MQVSGGEGGTSRHSSHAPPLALVSASPTGFRGADKGAGGAECGEVRGGADIGARGGAGGGASVAPPGTSINHLRESLNRYRVPPPTMTVYRVPSSSSPSRTSLIGAACSTASTASSLPSGRKTPMGYTDPRSSAIASTAMYSGVRDTPDTSFLEIGSSRYTSIVHMFVSVIDTSNRQQRWRRGRQGSAGAGRAAPPTRLASLPARLASRPPRRIGSTVARVRAGRDVSTCRAFPEMRAAAPDSTSSS